MRRDLVILKCDDISCRSEKRDIAMMQCVGETSIDDVTAAFTLHCLQCRFFVVVFYIEIRTISFICRMIALILN